jgi:hypothetical protein
MATVLKAAELSQLARIAGNPKLARREKDSALKSLRGYARNVAKVLMGEKTNASYDVEKTAAVVRRWTSRQK